MKWPLFPSCFDSRSVSWLPPLLFASLVQLSSSFLDTKSQWLKVFICIFISYPNPSASLWFWSQISAKNFKRWNHQSIYHVIWVAKQLTRDRWYLLAIFGTGESLLICVIQLRILAIRLGFLIKTRTLLVWAPNHPMKIWKGFVEVGLVVVGLVDFKSFLPVSILGWRKKDQDMSDIFLNDPLIWLTYLRNNVIQDKTVVSHLSQMFLFWFW